MSDMALPYVQAMSFVAHFEVGLPLRVSAVLFCTFFFYLIVSMVSIPEYDVVL